MIGIFFLNQFGLSNPYMKLKLNTDTCYENSWADQEYRRKQGDQSIKPLPHRRLPVENWITLYECDKNGKRILVS